MKESVKNERTVSILFVFSYPCLILQLGSKHLYKALNYCSSVLINRSLTNGMDSKHTPRIYLI